MPYLVKNKIQALEWIRTTNLLLDSRECYHCATTLSEYLAILLA